MPSPPRKILLFFLLAVPLVLFWRVQHFEFLNYDDNVYVTQNPSLRVLTSETVRIWFTKPHVNSYVPIPLMSYALDFHLQGPGPEGFHRTNLILHLANILLVFFLLERWTENRLAAFGAALLWGVHPVQAESVAWISERKTLLYAFFLFAGFNLWVRARANPKPPWWNWGMLLGCFLASLLSKINAAMIPFVFAAYDYFEIKEGSKKRRIFYAGLAAVAVSAGVAALKFYPNSLAGLRSIRPLSVLVHQGGVWAFYLKQIFFPFDLRFLYPEAGSLWPSAWMKEAALLAAGLMALILLAAIVKKYKYGFGLIGFVVFLLPVANFFPVPVNDRHLYVPLAGILICLLSLARIKPVAAPFLLAAVLVLSPVTYARLSVFENGETLWASILAKDPLNFKALMQMGGYYLEQELPERAIPYYEQVIAAYPKQQEAYGNLASIYFLQDKPEKAEALAAQLDQNNPEQPEASFIRASAAYLRGDTAGAEALMKTAIARKAKNPALLINIGRLALRQGRYPQAKEAFRGAISLKKDSAEAYYLIVLCYMDQQQWQSALGLLNRMMQRGLDYPGVYFQKGYARLKLGDRDGAKKEYLKSIAAHPEIPEAYHHLGLLSLQGKKPREALYYFETAARLRPEQKLYAEMAAKVRDELRGR